MNARAIQLLPAPEQRRIGIPEPTLAMRRLAVAFEPAQKLRVPVTHHDVGFRPVVRASVEVLPAAAAFLRLRHWGINE